MKGLPRLQQFTRQRKVALASGPTQGDGQFIYSTCVTGCPPAYSFAHDGMEVNGNPAKSFYRFAEWYPPWSLICR